MFRKMSVIRNPGFVAKEICNDIKSGIVTKEQGKEALFNLLLMACGARVKEKRK